MASILFVCLGNICRSPAAEGILRQLADKDDANMELTVQSCGLGSWHVGNLPDIRMQEAAKRRGVVLSNRAQQFQPHFLDSFDYILAADHEILKELYRFADTSEKKNKIHLMTAFSNSYKDQEVPDPYYEGDLGFELVLDILEDSCQGLLKHIKINRSS